MNKFLIILTLLVVTFGTSAWVFFKPQEPRFEEFIEVKSVNSDLEKLPCDLNTKEHCVVNFKDKEIEFGLSPRPIYTMQPVSMHINGLDKIGFSKPSLEVHGVNMDMGIIKAELKQKAGGYSADLVLSACLIDVMRYRFEVYNEGLKTGLFIDLDLHQ
jgi:hypothetical protein